MQFWYLAALLRDWEVGKLATAIEVRGIYRYDRYGRMKHFGPQEAGAIEALDLLADYAAGWESDVSATPFDEAEIHPNSGWACYGWPADQLPAFDEIENQQVTVPRVAGTKKRDNADLAIIGALLSIIKGVGTIAKHPDYKSEAQLIQLIELQFHDYPGLKRRSLEDKFAEGKRIIALQ